MKCSVLIPTHARPTQLERCLRSLAAQGIDGFEAEVIVGIDGDDDGEADVAQRCTHAALPIRTAPGLHAGPAATRNRIIEQATGEALLFLNDDAVAAPGLLAAHVRAQRELAEQGRAAMVLGSAPWAIEQPDRVIDRLTRETSMIFFYDQMTGAGARDPEHDWGWRHAWALNLSLPARCVREVGGFCELLDRPVYEDIEMAFRIHERFGAPTLYRPEAKVIHHHRYEPVVLLAREYVLGHQGRRLAQASPDCAHAIFHSDPLEEIAIDKAQAIVESKRSEATRLLGELMDVSLGPSSSIGADGVKSIYRLYVRCREYLRAMGLADAGRGRACQPPTAWLKEITASVGAPC